MAVNRFVLNGISYHGHGAIQEIPGIVKSKGFKKAFVASDPDLVMNFFNKLSSDLYSKLGDMMKSTEFSSSFTIYDDKLMKKQYNNFSQRLEDAQNELTDLEDYYYDKFASMETALSKLDGSSNALAGLVG